LFLWSFLSNYIGVVVADFFGIGFPALSKLISSYGATIPPAFFDFANSS
jgi:hypothetical protein